MSVVSFAGIGGEERQQLLDKSVRSHDGEYAECFAEATVRFLREDEVDGGEVWDIWLSAHIQNRLAGIPRNAKPEELAYWADVIPYLGAAISAGIAVFGQNVPGFVDNVLVHDLPAGVLSAHGLDLVEFFAARIRNTATLGFEIQYRIRDLVDVIEQELDETAAEPLRAAARAKGLSDDALL
ncbi:hypothetical protein SAMN06309944_0554 [Micrococcales bacterium KH10]|nr:hypothetical protein SAMN06309944_0554 [Micrococcales bacterium KH10]